MGAVLVAMLGPTVVFGLFALLAVRFGAESRPYFDERPVIDERPNWFAIPRRLPGDDEDEKDEDDDEPGGGTPAPVPEAAPAPRRQRAPVAVASPSRAATSPSGV
jgi:hypothetical protein